MHLIFIIFFRQSYDFFFINEINTTYFDLKCDTEAKNWNKDKN